MVAALAPTTPPLMATNGRLRADFSLACAAAKIERERLKAKVVARMERSGILGVQDSAPHLFVRQPFFHQTRQFLKLRVFMHQRSVVLQRCSGNPRISQGQWMRGFDGSSAFQ